MAPWRRLNCMGVNQRFWRGRIETPEHARKVIRLASSGFAIGTIIIALVAMKGVTPNLVAVVLLFGALTMALRRRSSVWAARIWMAMFALFLAVMIGLWVQGSQTTESPVIGCCVWALGLGAAIRAHAATMFLRTPQRHVAAVFE